MIPPAHAGGTDSALGQYHLRKRMGPRDPAAHAGGADSDFKIQNVQPSGLSSKKKLKAPATGMFFSEPDVK